jgi:hypothetical protein
LAGLNAVDKSLDGGGVRMYLPFVMSSKSA